MVWLLVAAGCSSGVGSDPGPGLSEGVGDDLVVERALVACYQDQGMDAELRPDGGLSANGGSAEEVRAITALCKQELVDRGILVEEPTDATKKQTYEAFQSLWRCLIEEGYQVPELVTFEVFISDSGEFVHPLAFVLEQQGGEAEQEASEACPAP